ncbi:MAG: hypothetical protein KatS3mg076_3001 [Candidatus Binatia bacterium]|nr:MAG: hypothetical protein KatS3mg076_3001 [Candidatus Binatia bacterium]
MRRPDPQWEVLCALRRRGIPSRSRRAEPILLPNSERRRSVFYDLLRHYSFRLYLRDLIRLREGAPLPALARYCSARVAERYTGELERLGLVRRTPEGLVRLRRQDIASFGPTLEWFVAEVLRREFGFAVASGLRPSGTRAGGDYDVLALADGALVYVEVKSSAPRNIERSQIAAFVDRIAALVPDAAILLNDTQLRMLDKLVPAVRAELRRAPYARGPFRRVQGEIFSRGDKLFVTNSEPDLVANLGVCIARFFRSRARA